jgi:hypothetical protein
MKKPISALIALAALLLLVFGNTARAGSPTNINTLNPVVLLGTNVAPGTNYSQAIIIGYAAFQNSPTFAMNQFGLSNSDAGTFCVFIGTSTNTATGTCVSTNQFPTNTVTGILSTPVGTQVPIYGWVRNVVTNNTTVWDAVVKTPP